MEEALNVTVRWRPLQPAAEAAASPSSSSHDKRHLVGLSSCLLGLLRAHDDLVALSPPPSLLLDLGGLGGGGGLLLA